MLSFDITDRHVRIVRGTESGGKIRISSASTIDLSEGLIVNGHIKDIPKMATIINDELKARRMDDKEAVVTLSSNLVIFKELVIPKAKTSTALLTMVTNQMQHNMGIAEEYSISYSIAGEVEQEGNQCLKILATACPFEVVDCFKKVFSMLSIGLKSVSVSCNAISRIILSDKKSAARMPMLVVQVDPNFVSINLYEEGQLSFARFASIDAVDYDNSEDYVYEAVNENIHRMVQFHKSRNPENPIQNVVFYGDTTEYIRLTNSLENMDISTSLLGVPNNISGYENIEFQAYANAIGAMFKSNKSTDRINLLETDAAAGKNDAGSGFFIQLGLTALLSCAVVGAIFLGFSNTINNNDKKVSDIDAWMNAPEQLEKINEVDSTQAKIDKVNLYKADLDKAIYNFNTKPHLTIEMIETMTEPFLTNNCMVDTISFSSGFVTLNCYSDDNRAPDLAVQALIDLDEYDNIVYTGFIGGTAEELGPDATDAALDVINQFSFTVTFNVRPLEVEVEEDEPEVVEDGGEE
ncbi:MAG: pilus assembly protein PilM [Ruminococcus sp.]|nr:pilus assembly protein PilM [Ruminococcus sp.]